VREEGEYFYISDGLEVNDQLVLTLPEYPQAGMEVKIAGMKEMTSDAETAAVEKL
jgi:multidrug efflux system membrane fusion protein